MTQESDIELFRHAFATHASFVRGLLVRLTGPPSDIEDLVQEVFMVAWRRRARYDRALPLRGWLTGIAVRVAAQSRRRKRWRRWVGLEDAAEVASHGTPASTFESAEAARMVYSVLDRLSEKKRSVFILYEIQGMSGEEIAQIVGCPLKTVWTRLFHARREFQAGVAKTRAALELASEARP